MCDLCMRSLRIVKKTNIPHTVTGEFSVMIMQDAPLGNSETTCGYVERTIWTYGSKVMAKTRKFDLGRTWSTIGLTKWVREITTWSILRVGLSLLEREALTWSKLSLIKYIE